MCSHKLLIKHVSKTYARFRASGAEFPSYMIWSCAGVSGVHAAVNLADA